MSIDLVINFSSQEVKIALLKDKVLTELHSEKGSNDFSVGDVYLGKIRKVIPSLNASFVDVGFEKDAFLHYLDSKNEVLVKNTLNFLIFLVRKLNKKLTGLYEKILNSVS